MGADSPCDLLFCRSILYIKFRKLLIFNLIQNSRMESKEDTSGVLNEIPNFFDLDEGVRLEEVGLISFDVITKGRASHHRPHRNSSRTLKRPEVRYTLQKIFHDVLDSWLRPTPRSTSWPTRIPLLTSPRCFKYFSKRTRYDIFINLTHNRISSNERVASSP